MRKVVLKETKDYQAIAKMDAILFPIDYPIENWEVYTWFLGTCNKIPVCYCGVRKMDEFGYLNRTGVLPSFQGKGLQKRMIRKRIQWCKARNLTDVISSTSCDNAGSMINLIRCGFLPYTPEEGWMSEDSVYWKKSICPKQ